jgi:hypothetical protein
MYPRVKNRPPRGVSELQLARAINRLRAPRGQNSGSGKQVPQLRQVCLDDVILTRDWDGTPVEAQIVDPGKSRGRRSPAKGKILSPADRIGQLVVIRNLFLPDSLFRFARKFGVNERPCEVPKEANPC